MLIIGFPSLKLSKLHVAHFIASASIRKTTFYKMTEQKLVF